MMNQQAWATEFFRVVDSQQADAIAAYMTEDVSLQMGNTLTLQGIDAVKMAFEAAADRFSSVTHVLEGVWLGQWELGEVISVEMLVHYELPTGQVITLPCTSTLRLKGDKIADYRVYMDPRPVFDD